MDTAGVILIAAGKADRGLELLRKAVAAAPVVRDAVAALDAGHGRALLSEWATRGIQVMTCEQLLA